MFCAMKLDNILVIHRRSTYAEMTAGGAGERFNAMAEADDPIISEFMFAHRGHETAMETVRRILEQRGFSATWRYDLGGLVPDDFDLVITVGGDGTVLHASHSIGETPVLAVNSSPLTSVGYFTLGSADELAAALDAAMSGDMTPTRLYRMEVKVNGEVVNTRVLNDVLFSHDCPASTTRYHLSYPGGEDDQMSSGLWVSTAAGSTAAIRAAGGRIMRAGSRRLQFAVREPGPTGGENGFAMPKVTKGFVAESEVLSVRSKTSAARLYIDGPHVVIPVEMGDMVTFSGGSPPLNLLGYRSKNNS